MVNWERDSDVYETTRYVDITMNNWKLEITYMDIVGYKAVVIVLQVLTLVYEDPTILLLATKTCHCVCFDQC